MTTPALDRLEAAFRTQSPVFRHAVGRVRGELGETWAEAFDEAIARLLPDATSLSSAVAAYAGFALDALRLQARFEKTGMYEPRTYFEVAADVYANDHHMTSRYLPGLLLSNYLWPHHYRQLRFFEEFFVADMRVNGAERFCDIGVGTGIYSRLALIGVPEAVGVGIDISPSSAAFAERHVAAYGAGGRFSVELRDIQASPGPKSDWLVCVEVLEHLDDPVGFLVSLRAMLRVGGRAFIATALNAANADHIYLYRTTQVVREHLVEAGFNIERSFAATAHPPRGALSSAPEVAAFVVS